MPVLCADVNSGFGLQRLPGTDEWTRITHPSIGNAAPYVKQKYSADVVLKMIRDYDLVAVNTHRGAGPTYYGNASNPSQLDF
eukprot:6732040-Pyramimonas_sp.AAC.1